jgi:hypothetical protein
MNGTRPSAVRQVAENQSGSVPREGLPVPSQGGQHVVESSDAMAMWEDAGLLGPVPVFGDLPDSDGDSIFVNTAEREFAGQPSIEGLAVRLVGSDRAACVGQRCHGRGEWRWSVQPSSRKAILT